MEEMNPRSLFVFNNRWRQNGGVKLRFELVNQTVYLHIKLSLIVNWTV